MTSHPHTPFVLIILDGFGYREATTYNAIASARMPNWNEIWTRYPHCLLNASGKEVGLPEGQMGNSEVGHMNMGSGRLVYQDLTAIDHAIESGDFYKNPVFIEAIEKAVTTQKAIHILGLVSDGGVHSHTQHIHALLELAAQHNAPSVYIHAFLDGRDTPPKSAAPYLSSLEKKCHDLKCGQIASLIGRYYAMDRDQRWDRTKIAYDLLTTGEANYHATTAEEGLQQAYARDETDEFVKPTTIYNASKQAVTLNDGDVIIFMNFRSDRARQLTRAFTQKDFSGFVRSRHITLGEFVSLTQYATDIDTAIAYPPQTLQNGLGEYISKQGLTQLRIAETEKYAHVTFFFNGGIENPFPGETRLLIPSPKIATYDLQPEMSANVLTDQLIKAIQSQTFDLIICNFANPDMVGHTGNFSATINAVETIDNCLGRIEKALTEVGGEAIITADHGNAEIMFDEKTQQPHTAHTSDPVPFVYIGRPAQALFKEGVLSDIAPTILYLMELKIPNEMTANTLLELSDKV